MSFNHSQLPNGLNVVTFSMPYIQSVSINIIVRVGSRFEDNDESGISHFLEHMAFKGTDTRSAKDIAIEFDEIGGYFNAYTSREQTVYYTKILKEHTRQALEIMADILQNSTFREEEIKKELSVILQEIAGVQDNPDELAYEKFYRQAYGNSPIGRSILGERSVISKFDTDSFRSYLAKHYTAENIFISVAGNVAHDDIISYVQSLFSGITKAPKKTFTKATYMGGYDYINKKLEQTTVILGFESVSYLNLKEFYHTQILSLIFGGGLSSRLFQRIREDLGLVYSIGASNSSYLDSGVFGIYAAADHENIQLLLDNLVIEIDKIKQSITDEELARAKAQIKSSIYMVEEKPEYKSDEIGKNFALFGKYFSTEEVIEMVMSISKEQLTCCASNIFSASPTLTIVGKEPGNFDFYTTWSKLNK